MDHAIRHRHVFNPSQQEDCSSLFGEGTNCHKLLMTNPLEWFRKQKANTREIFDDFYYIRKLN